MRCQTCSSEILSSSRFCQNCGAALQILCPACNTQNEPNAKYCSQCGALISEATTYPHSGRFHQSDGTRISLSSAQLEGERKPVTILFTDIVGSTAIAEQLDPEEWKEIVTGAHRIVSESVRRYDGMVAQFLGDGVLAFFGAPVTHEDDPRRAVHAALDIQHELDSYRLRLRPLVADFQMRIGLHTGLVVVGAVGDDLYLEYLAVGDSVNLAARLQSAAPPGGVLISNTTAHLIAGAFELKDLGDITVKGKAEMVHVHEVIRASPQQVSGRGLVGLTSVMVGRSEELDGLINVSSRLEQGSGGIVFLLGEAGIGKSRLVEEVRRKSHPQLRWLEGRSLSYGSTLSYWAISQLILADLGLSDGDPALRRRVALHRRVAELLPKKVEAFLPGLEFLLGIGEDGEAARQIAALGGESFKHQLLQAISAYFQALANEQPVVLILDDFHWADASTLEAVRQILPLTNRSPILLLMVGRFDRAHGSWQLKFHAETDYSHRYCEFQLGPLQEQESHLLMENLLSISTLPDSIRSLIVDRSDGNPFYLEELLRSLIDQGDLIKVDETWRLTRKLSELDIPETLQGVLLARLDRLNEEVRRTLQIASVIGRSFLYRLLDMICEAEIELDRHLDELQRVDLVSEKTRLPELEYIFKHSLTQEAAYQSLLLERRREFHRRVAAALEDLFAGRQEEYAGLLAHHYDLAGEKEKALDYLLPAGDRARLLNSFAEAQRFYQRSLELLAELGDHKREIRTWLKLGLAHQAEFQFEQSQRAFENAFKLERQVHPSVAAATPYAAPEGQLRIMKVGTYSEQPPILDPGRTTTSYEMVLTTSLFAGLVQYDTETNILPHIARSWEVLDGGRRYLFHLRDDVRWTDGAPVSAEDFEYAWKHNLSPGARVYPANLLDDVLGARSYRLAENPDPDSVGVHALDTLTLEVRLEAPVAYFIYLMALPVAFPLPQQVVQLFGDNWWKLPNIQSNGAFRLVEYTPTNLRFMRNLDYFGEFTGNLDGIEIRSFPFLDPEIIQQFMQKNLDVCVGANPGGIPISVPKEIQFRHKILAISALVFNPTQPPLDDPRIRRAIAQGLDFQTIMELIYPGRDIQRSGGVVPSRVAGYSPELGQPYDLPLARHLLAEAGYPDGKGLPVLKLGLWVKLPGIDEMFRQLEENLGIHTEHVPISFPVKSEIFQDLHMTIANWVVDYPDPDNVLRQSNIVSFPKSVGWTHPRFDKLIEEAARSTDRLHRLALYREADRILVDEEVIVVPLSRGIDLGTDLIHPWVAGFEPNALGLVFNNQVRLERHF